MRKLVPLLVLVAAVLLFAVVLPGIAQEQQKTPLKFEPNDSIEALRAKIQYNGAQFTVAHNWVYDMSSEKKAEFFSRHPNTVRSLTLASDDMGPLRDKIGALALPASFDWRNYNGHSYIGPVRNQGNCGSCYSFGACGAAEGTWNVATGSYDSNCADFSESFIIWCLGTIAPYKKHFGGCNGADYSYAELQALCDYGLCNENAFPYTVANPGACTHWNDPRTKFSAWYRIPCGDIDAMKTAIMTYGPIDVAVDATSAFQAYSSGIFSDTATSCSTIPCYDTPTNHAIVLVGWNDNPGGTGYWILRNSWDSTWGESGYMRIGYTSARVSCEATYLTYNAVTPTGTPTPVLTATPTRTSTPALTVTPTSTPTPGVLLVNESFEGTFPPSGWTRSGCDKNKSAHHTGSYSVRFNSSKDYLITPLLSTPGTMTYWMRAAAGASSFNAQYSASRSGPWTHLPGSPTTTNYNNTFMQKTFNLSGYNNIYVRFSRNDSRTYYLDDLVVTRR
jgi:hypothetical protein